MVSKIFVFAPVCIFALYLVLFSNGVSANNITCYNCSSADDNGTCGDPLGSNVSTVSCDGSCAKVIYVTQNTTVTWRTCSAITNDTCGSLNDTLTTNNTDLSDFSCLACHTDFCNSSVTFGLPLITFVITFLSVRFL